MKYYYNNISRIGAIVELDDGSTAIVEIICETKQSAMELLGAPENEAKAGIMFNSQGTLFYYHENAIIDFGFILIKRKGES